MLRRYRRRNTQAYIEDAVDYISQSSNPLATLWAMKASLRLRYSPYLGAGPGGRLIWGEPNTHLLAIGAPQRGPGKTGSIAATNAIAHFGPAMVVGTKWDLVRNVTAPRVWVDEGNLPLQYNPAGPIDPGFTELRWSPLTACANDTATSEMWQLLVNSAVARERIDSNDVASDPRWMQLAKSLGCGLMRYASEAQRRGKSEYDCRWIAEQLQYKDLKALGAVADWLTDVGSTFAMGFAGHLKTGNTEAGGREVHGIFTTAQIIFEPWMTEFAIASQTDPNFDPKTFVDVDLDHNSWLRDPYLIEDLTHPGNVLAQQGIEPKTGHFQTVVMVVPQDQQLLAAPLIVALLGAVTRAAVRRKGLDERAGNYGRPNVGLVLDELANLAPLPNLPSLLSEGASQGVTIYGCLQTATQSLARWGEREGGHAMLANFGNVILMPGVTDPYTLDWFEQLGGRMPRETRSENYNFDSPGSRSGYTIGHDEVWRYPKDQLREGHPQSPDLAMMTQGGRMGWGYCTPVHRARPWLPLLLSAFDALMNDSYLDEMPDAAALPWPDLDRLGNGGALSNQQQMRFRDAIKRRNNWAYLHPRSAYLRAKSQEQPWPQPDTEVAS